MQALFQTGLDELFTFSDTQKRNGAMILFGVLLAKAKELFPDEHATFIKSLKSDPNVAAEVSKAKAEIAAARELITYWGTVVGEKANDVV